ELSEDEVEKLDGLNKQAVKLEAQIKAEENLAKAEKDDAERIEREKREAVEEAVKKERAAARRLQSGEAPYLAKYGDTNRYDEMSAGDVSLMIDVLNANNKPVSGSAFKALSLKIGELKNTSNTEEGEK